MLREAALASLTAAALLIGCAPRERASSALPPDPACARIGVRSELPDSTTQIVDSVRAAIHGFKPDVCMAIDSVILEGSEGFGASAGQRRIRLMTRPDEPRFYTACDGGPSPLRSLLVHEAGHLYDDHLLERDGQRRNYLEHPLAEAFFEARANGTITWFQDALYQPCFYGGHPWDNPSELAASLSHLVTLRHTSRLRRSLHYIGAGERRQMFVDSLLSAHHDRFFLYRNGRDK